MLEVAQAGEARLARCGWRFEGDLKTRLPRLEARLGFQDEAAEARLARAIRTFRKVYRTGLSSKDRLIV